MRKAISYWAMRVWISGSPKLLEVALVELAQGVEHGAAVCSVTPGGFCT